MYSMIRKESLKKIKIDNMYAAYAISKKELVAA